MEDKAFGMLHYFFEAVLPMIEVNTSGPSHSDVGRSHVGQS